MEERLAAGGITTDRRRYGLWSLKKEDLSDLASKRINKHNGRALTQKNGAERRFVKGREDDGRWQSSKEGPLCRMETFSHLHQLND